MASTKMTTAPSGALPGDAAAPHRSAALQAGVLGAIDITFMVIAVAAPMAVVVSTMPIAFAFGNGVGLPGTYLIAGLALLLFAAGYVQMLPHVRNAGAFYALVASAFGVRAGLAAAYVALLSYVALTAATLGALSWFLADGVSRLGGGAAPWHWCAVASVAVLGALSYRRIDFTARLLAMALLAEVAVIVLLDLAILRSGGHGSALAAWHPAAVFSPGLGIGAIYAFNSCIGFEGTAIYQEEARDRARTIPRATYASVIVIAVFYTLTAWCFTLACGPAIAVQAGRDPGHFVGGLARAYLGQWGQVALDVLTVTSAFAAMLGMFNACARYVFALAREGALPRRLAQTRPANGSPFVAGLPVLAIMLALVAAFRALGLDPLLSMTTSLTGLGSVGLMALLAITAFGVPVFCRRRRVGGLAVWLSPVGGAILAAATLLSVIRYPLLTGSASPLINSLPLLLPLAAGLGVWRAKASPRQ